MQLKGNFPFRQRRGKKQGIADGYHRVVAGVPEKAGGSVHIDLPFAGDNLQFLRSGMAGKQVLKRTHVGSPCLRGNDRIGEDQPVGAVFSF